MRRNAASLLPCKRRIHGCQGKSACRIKRSSLIRVIRSDVVISFARGSQPLPSRNGSPFAPLRKSVRRVAERRRSIRRSRELLIPCLRARSTFWPAFEPEIAIIDGARSEKRIREIQWIISRYRSIVYERARSFFSFRPLSIRTPRRYGRLEIIRGEGAAVKHVDG